MCAAVEAEVDWLQDDHPGWKVWFVLDFLGVRFCAAREGRQWMTVHAYEAAHLAQHMDEADEDAAAREAAAAQS